MSDIFYIYIVLCIIIASALFARAISGPDTGYTSNDYTDDLCGRRGDF